VIEELLVAAAIGASLGNSWACALLSLACSVDSRKAGIAFIGGRYLGLILLGGAIAALGLAENLNPVYFLVTFGILTVALGVFVLARIVTRHYLLRHGRSLFRLLHRGRHHPGGDVTMPDGGEIALRPDSSAKAAYVFGLGVLRGATPCVKIMVLAPLLISVDFGLALGMVLVFATASAIYPVIGFLSGNVLRRSKRHELYLRVGASVLMIALGIYFVANAFLVNHSASGAGP